MYNINNSLHTSIFNISINLQIFWIEHIIYNLFRRTEREYIIYPRV